MKKNAGRATGSTGYAELRRAVVYCRVSTKEQVENLSLPTQEAACRAYCERDGIEVDRVFLELGESAKTANRTELGVMLDYLRKNRGRIDFCIVYALSRFSRDVGAHFALRAHLQSLGITLRSATEPISDDATGKLMETILAGFANFDNDVRRDRTIAGMQAALQRGRWTFEAPIGYVRDDGGALAIDPFAGPLVREGFESFASGAFTKNDVLRTLTRKGLRGRTGKPVSIGQFNKLLANPLYYGRLRVKRWGVDVAGAFPAIVTEEVFNRVQLIIAGRRPAVKVHLRARPDFPLRHFVRCTCGRPLTGSWSKGRSRSYAYYHCPKGCISATKGELEARFCDLLDRLKPKPEYVKLFNAVVLDVWKMRHANVAAEKTSAAQRLATLRQRQERLDQAFLFDLSIDRETYMRQRDRVRDELVVGEMETKEATIEELDAEYVIAFAGRVVENASALWNEAGLEYRQKLQAVLFPENLVFTRDGFLEPATCLAFNWLQPSEAEMSAVVRPEEFESPTF